MTPPGAHSHAGHSHGPGLHVHGPAAGEGSAARIATALGLILLFMAGEIVAGILGHSLALLSDAAHMLTDAAALGLSLAAIRIARRPARGAMTYGWRRVEILSAQLNGATLLVLAALITYSAILRLVDPGRPSGATMIGVALGGILINGLATWILAGADRSSMNIEGSFQHILTDLFAFIGTALAGGLILATGFARADPIISLLVAALLLRASLGLLRESARVFMEAAPRGLEPAEIGNLLAAQAGVVEVHDLHVWEVSSGFPSLSAHILVSPEADCHAIRRRLQSLLEERFDVEHSTLQVDHERSEELLELHMPAPGQHRDAS